MLQKAGHCLPAPTCMLTVTGFLAPFPSHGTIRLYSRPVLSLSLVTLSPC